MTYSLIIQKQLLEGLPLGLDDEYDTWISNYSDLDFEYFNELIITRDL